MYKVIFLAKTNKILQVLNDRTPERVGPGCYQIEEAIKKLKSKPGAAVRMAKLIINEGYFEVVNDCRVFQPKYLKKNEQHIIQMAKSAYGMKMNESILLYKGLRQNS